jgi:hypothetical protein
MDSSELLERTRPPDPELVDLIEWAFLDGQKADLAYLWIQARGAICAKRPKSNVGRFVVAKI